MYLSSLLIETGDNPDRPRPGRSWLRNHYHVHQRLCMAFPTNERKVTDANFLKRYDPSEFAVNNLGKVRSHVSGFLFRIDPLPAGRAAIVVQSSTIPDWDYAFQNAGYLLAAPPEIKKYEPIFLLGQRLRFRLTANPVKKIDTVRKEERLKHSKNEYRKIPGRHGKRVPLPNDQLLDWLSNRSERSGFSIESNSTVISPCYVFFKKQQHKHVEEENLRQDCKNFSGQRLRSVRYDGILEIKNSGLFMQTITQGIGPGKAFGFGLLSVAPVNTSV